MGCDIHGIVERRSERGWFNAGDLPILRDYYIFAIIAGVRSDGSVPTISEPRGIPGCEGVPFEGGDDPGCFSILNSLEMPSLAFLATVKGYGADGHSHSFVGLDEIKQVNVRKTNDGRESLFHSSYQEAKEDGFIGSEVNYASGAITDWDQLIQNLESKKQAEDDSDSDIRIVFFFDN